MTEKEKKKKTSYAEATRRTLPLGWIPEHKKVRDALQGVNEGMKKKKKKKR